MTRLSTKSQDTVSLCTLYSVDEHQNDVSRPAAIVYHVQLTSIQQSRQLLQTRVTDGQNYDSQDRASIAASR